MNHILREFVDITSDITNATSRWRKGSGPSKMSRIIETITTPVISSENSTVVNNNFTETTEKSVELTSSNLFINKITSKIKDDFIRSKVNYILESTGKVIQRDKSTSETTSSKMIKNILNQVITSPIDTIVPVDPVYDINYDKDYQLNLLVTNKVDDLRGESTSGPGFFTKEIIIILVVITGLLFVLICVVCLFICTSEPRKIKNVATYKKTVDILNRLQEEDNEARAMELKRKAHILVDTM